MRVLIDANVLLDVLQAREPHLETSSLIWKMCETGGVDGHVSALTFANLVYVMRRELDSRTIEEVLSKLEMIFTFEGLLPADLRNAAALRWHDFEDAVQYVTARRIHAERIVTRNVRDFAESPIRALSPQEFLEELTS